MLRVFKAFCWNASIALLLFWCLSFSVAAFLACLLPVEDSWSPTGITSIILHVSSQSMTRLRRSVLSLTKSRSGGKEDAWVVLLPLFDVDVLKLVCLAAHASFMQYIREFLFVILVMHCTPSIQVVLKARLPEWLQELIDMTFDTEFWNAYKDDNCFNGMRRGYEEEEDDSPSEPPALEDINAIHEERIQQQQEWYVFDPVYGVIPQDTRDLWIFQEKQAKEWREEAIKRHQAMGGNPALQQPIRFRKTVDSNTSAAAAAAAAAARNNEAEPNGNSSTRNSSCNSSTAATTSRSGTSSSTKKNTNSGSAKKKKKSKG